MAKHEITLGKYVLSFEFKQKAGESEKPDPNSCPKDQNFWEWSEHRSRETYHELAVLVGLDKLPDYNPN